MRFFYTWRMCTVCGGAFTGVQTGTAPQHGIVASILQVSAAWAQQCQICRTDERWSPRDHSSVVTFRRRR